MCNGNPLEAKDTLQAYVMQKTFNDIDLIPFLSDNFQKRVDEITTRHEKNFLSDKDLVFKAEFDAILPFVDTNINIKNSYMEETIRKVMNRQFMTINPKTYYLECLHPAASHAFKKLRKGSSVATALLTILYTPGQITADAIGRLLEYYIIDQLKSDETKSQTITLKYSTKDKNDLELSLAPYAVSIIETGKIIPNEPMNQNTLFIPESPIYPYVDLLYLDFYKKILYAMQVTVNMKSHKDSHEDFETTDFKRWKEIYREKLKLQFIWIGGGWKPEKLKYEVNSDAPAIGDSWKITYKQFPIIYFPLFQYIQEKVPASETSFLVRKVSNINQLMGENFRKNTAVATFQKKCSEWFAKEAATVKSEVVIYGFIEAVENDSYTCKLNFDVLK